MKCPICGARLHSGTVRCTECGCHIQAYSDPAEETPSRGERVGIGRVIVTVLMLLPVLCIIVFTTLISVSVRSAREPVSSAPSSDQTVNRPSLRETLPQPETDDDCFALIGGKLAFLPEHWDGGPVLHVPETVDGRTVTALAPGCFSGCTELTTIILPDTLQQIGPKAFFGCTRLRGLFVPENTTVIGTDAFLGCPALEAIYIPASVRSIAEDCFRDCSGLLYIFYEGSFEDWNELYDDYITPFTAAICLDGTYYHGTGR